MNGMPQSYQRAEPRTVNHLSKSWIMIVVIGCSTIAGVLWAVNSRAKRLMVTAVDSSGSSKPKQELLFRLTTIFDGRTEGGQRYSNSFYKTPDCESLSEVAISFNSPEEAKRELESEQQKASTVVEHTAILDSHGLQIGERVAFQVNKTEQQGPYAEVAWTSDKDFHSISSTSLERLFEFESALQSRSGKISTQNESLQEVTFTPLIAQQGSSGDVSYAEQLFRTSDCETVAVRTEVFTTAKRAESELEERLKAATSIVQGGPRPDARTEQTGRVVAMFTAPTHSEQLEDTVVLWTANRELISIKGTMLHALEFEKRNYR